MRIRRAPHAERATSITTRPGGELNILLITIAFRRPGRRRDVPWVCRCGHAGFRHRDPASRACVSASGWRARTSVGVQDGRVGDGSNMAYRATTVFRFPHRLVKTGYGARRHIASDFATPAPAPVGSKVRAIQHRFYVAGNCLPDQGSLPPANGKKQVENEDSVDETPLALRRNSRLLGVDFEGLRKGPILVRRETSGETPLRAWRRILQGRTDDLANLPL